MKKHLLTIILIFAVSLAPITMRAATASELVATISDYNLTSGGTGSLTAIADGNTVTVTGSLIDVTSVLSLDIDADVTMVWQASISTGNDFQWNFLIQISGSGTFDVDTGGSISATNDGGKAIQTYGNIVVSGGEVSSTTGTAIAAIAVNSIVTVNSGTISTITGSAITAPGVNSTVMISGTSLVQATGDGGIAIICYGSLDVSGGEVSATTCYAIVTNGDNSTVTISGGTVSNSSVYSYWPVIFMMNNNNTGLNITVNGTGKVQATGDGGVAISTFGNVEVSGGEVSATTNTAISANEVTVGGTGKVEASDYGTAIIASGNVEVNGGEVSATTGTAIYASGDNSTVTVSGTGKVQATSDNGGAIITSGNVEVNSGEVSATTGKAILANGENPMVVVSGTGKVQATNDDGMAIYTSGNVEINGGEVSATTGRAITNLNGNSTVTISGGLVFAYGDAIIGNTNVIYTANPSSFTDATGEGVVIAWNQAAGNTTYTQGSAVDISQSPTSATVQWDKSGADFGISYTNGTNTGFIPLGVTVVSAACDVASIESPVGATITDQTITASVANNVTSQVVSITTSAGASWKLFSDSTCTNVITDSVMALSVGDNTAYIKVTAEDGTTTKIYTIVVTRAELTLSVSPSSLSFAAVSEQQTFDITSNTDWTISSSASWVTVSPTSGNGNTTVTVTAATNTATSTRTATLTVGGTGVSTQTVSVTQAAAPTISVTSVTLDVTSVGLTPGETRQMTATVAPSNATNQNITWSSSDKTVATVSGTGLITAVSEGTAIVTVTTDDGNFTATCTVTVARALNPDASLSGLSVSEGTLTPTFSPSVFNYTVSVGTDVTSIDISATANDAAASVSGDGTMTLNAGGNVFEITVTAENGDRQVYTITVNRAEPQQEVVVPDSVQTEPGGKGTMVLSLTIPTDVLFSGSFLLTLPNGVQLDLAATRLIDSLATQLTLNIVQESDSSWTFNITSQTLRSANEMVYSQIMEIGYIVNETVAKGTYDASISDLSFEFEDGSTVEESELPLQLTVTSTTGIPELSTGINAYLYGDRLYIESPIAETIQVYSVNGVLLYNFQKLAGRTDYLISQAPGSVLVVKGGSGWVKKVMK